MTRASSMWPRPGVARPSSPRSSTYRHFRRDGVDYLLRKTPALANRISALQYTTPLLASAPLGLHVPQVVSEGPQGRLMLVGDAAGTPDPISAGGLALALSATRSAADAVVSGDLASYQRRRLGMGRRAARLGQLMLRLSQSERRATFVLRRFSSDGSEACRGGGAVQDHRPWSTLACHSAIVTPRT